MLHQTNKKIQIMASYQILVSGYRNGYLTNELIMVQSNNIENAAIIAENKSSLDGAAARI